MTNSGHSRQIWQVCEIYNLLMKVRYVGLVFRAVLIVHSFISSAGVHESQLYSDVDSTGLVWCSEACSSATGGQNGL